MIGRYGGHKWHGFWLKVWMHEKHSLSVQSLGQQGCLKQTQDINWYNKTYMKTNCKHYNTLRCPPCYSNTFYQKISRPQRYQTCKPNFNQLYGSSPLIGFNYMIQELKHELLESSKQLPSIKLSKTVIYKSMQVFSNIPSTTCSIFCFQPNTNQFILTQTLQIIYQ